MNLIIQRNLKYLRKKNKMSQGDLAKLFDKTTGAVSDYEMGRTKIPIDIIDIIVKEFDVNAHELLYKDMENGFQVMLHPESIAKKEYDELKIKYETAAKELATLKNKYIDLLEEKKNG